MPQTAQHSLVQVLLLWITILSIIQVVFITLFFTQDKNYQNCSAVDPEYAMQTSTNNKSSSNTLRLGKGKMVTFRGATGNGRVKWKPRYPIKGLLSLKDDGEVLSVEKDGSYFINLQVTLSCEKNLLSKDIEVCLKLTASAEPKTILQGRIKTDTCSTGPLLKAVDLSEGRLEVIINQQPFILNETESLTHLDIIYMSK